jgi:hypothetical protein
MELATNCDATTQTGAIHDLRLGYLFRFHYLFEFLLSAVTVITQYIFVFFEDYNSQVQQKAPLARNVSAPRSASSFVQFAKIWGSNSFK